MVNNYPIGKYYADYRIIIFDPCGNIGRYEGLLDVSALSVSDPNK